MVYAVLTTVQVLRDSIDSLANLFDETNRPLVAGHEDWLGAWFTANRDTDEVTVVARWRSADSYQALRNSPEFQATMAEFAKAFTSPPKVSVNEILVEM